MRDIINDESIGPRKSGHSCVILRAKTLSGCDDDDSGGRVRNFFFFVISISFSEFLCVIITKGGPDASTCAYGGDLLVTFNRITSGEI